MENRSESIGRAVGFVLAYVIFTSVLFLLLYLLGKISAGNYRYVILITSMITLAGVTIKGWLD